MKNHFKNIARNLINLTGYTVRKINENDIPLYVKLFGEESVNNRRFYNIAAGGHTGFGCGFHHPCWTNIDLDRPWPGAIEYNPRRDIAHDLLSMKPIPVDSGSAELVYSRLSIEHIPDPAAQYMFTEVFRMLKPGGIFRVVTPNIDLDYSAYSNNDVHFFSWEKNVSMEQAFLTHFAAKASLLRENGSITDEEFRNQLQTRPFNEALDYCTAKCPIDLLDKNRQDHRNWWNPHKLEQFLSKAGFKTIYLSAAEQSASPVMRNEDYFDNVCNRFMVFMEAKKS
jgi:SAM-dependent methyltransferase